MSIINKLKIDYVNIRKISNGFLVTVQDKVLIKGGEGGIEYCTEEYFSEDVSAVIELIKEMLND